MIAKLYFKTLILALALLLSACQSFPTTFLTSESTQDIAHTEAPSIEQKIEAQEPELDFTPCLAEQEQMDPEAFSNVWQRVKQQLAMDVPDNRRIRAQQNWYSKHPEYMQRVSERAAPYLYYIVEELEKNNMPLELALLPIVESAFDPFAYSHGRASGMWQFIPGTGKSFGLEQNWWFDGRRDVHLSTQAAIKYLNNLNKRFDGNWLHALAAYNSGGGNVNRAIRKNRKKGKATDFRSLDLPKETRAYVPKLLALANILKLNNDENLWTPILNAPYFERVATHSQIDLSLAASLAEISMTEFYQLNPAYNQWATAPKGPHQILLPINKVATFQQNLNKIPTQQRISFKKYKVKKGDSLIRIAKKFATQVNLLKDNNNLRGNAIREGQNLLIPVASKAREAYQKSAQQRLITSNQHATPMGALSRHRRLVLIRCESTRFISFFTR